MNQIFEDITKSFLDIPARIKKTETYCLRMMQEVCRTKSENFERQDSHFEVFHHPSLRGRPVDGIKATYKCAFDGRLYDVIIRIRS